MIEPTDLAVCRNKDDLNILLKRKGENNLIVATDDPAVESAAIERAEVTSVIAIESMQSVANVWDEVLHTTQWLNALMSVDQNVLPPAVVEWMLWAEGGDTTQRVQDLLLLLDSYAAFLTREVENVLIVRRIATRWEDDILVAAATQAGKNAVEVQTTAFALTRWMFLKATRTRVLGRDIEVFLPMWVNTFLKKVLLTSKTWFCSLTYPITRKGDKGRNLVFLVANSHGKHIDNAAVLMKEFEKRDGWFPMALCWRAKGAYKALRDADLPVAQLESWLPLLKFPEVFREYRQSRRQISGAINRLEAGTLVYKDIDLIPFLKPFVAEFVMYELLERTILFHALRKFLDVNYILLIRTWGAGIFPLGRICHHLLQEEELRSNEPRPLIFDNVVGTNNLFLPVASDEACDLILVPGEHDKEMTKAHGGVANHLVVAGFGRDSGLQDFGRDHTMEESREILDVDTTAICNIFYASSGILRGFVSPQEHYRVADYLLGFAQSHPKVALMIKPHPAEDISYWRRIVALLDAPNIHLTDKELSPYHCVQLCDLMITKVSTLAFEAMEFGKPVISISLDGDERSQETYGDSILKFTDLDALDGFLEYLLTDSTNLTTWCEQATKKQEEFLPSKMFRPDIPVEAYMVDRVLDLLGNEMTLRKTIIRRTGNTDW